MNRRVLLIGVGAALLLTLLWFFVFWGPRNSALDDAKERRTTAEEQRNSLQAEIDRLRAAQREEPAKRARLEAFRAAIPDDPNLAQFILDSNDAANRAGIEFISISPSVPTGAAAPGAPAAGAPAAGAPAAGATPTTAPATTTTAPTATTAPGAAPGAAPAAPAAAGTRPAEVRLSMQIKGGYFQVLDFLNRLEDLPRLVVTDSLTITADQNGRLTVSLTARMFSRSVPPAFASSAAPGATGSTPTTAPTSPTAPTGRP